MRFKINLLHVLNEDNINFLAINLKNPKYDSHKKYEIKKRKYNGAY